MEDLKTVVSLVQIKTFLIGELKKMKTWIDAKTNPPEKTGRYLIMTTFMNPCVCNGAIVREHVPFVSNYHLDKGWMSSIEEQDITHWMEIPSL